jgi:hypothetical protein
VLLGTHLNLAMSRHPERQTPNGLRLARVSPHVQQVKHFETAKDYLDRLLTDVKKFARVGVSAEGIAVIIRSPP